MGGPGSFCGVVCSYLGDRLRGKVCELFAVIYRPRGAVSPAHPPAFSIVMPEHRLKTIHKFTSPQYPPAARRQP